MVDSDCRFRSSWKLRIFDEHLTGIEINIVTSYKVLKLTFVQFFILFHTVYMNTPESSYNMLIRQYCVKKYCLTFKGPFTLDAWSRSNLRSHKDQVDSDKVSQDQVAFTLDIDMDQLSPSVNAINPDQFDAEISIVWMQPNNGFRPVVLMVFEYAGNWQSIPHYKEHGYRNVLSKF